MKKTLAIMALMAGVLFPKIASATEFGFPFSDVVMASSMVINTALTAGTTKDLDTDLLHMDWVTVQINYSSGTTTAVTFNDGVTSTGSITVAGLTSLTTAYALNTITVSEIKATASTETITVISTTGLSGQTLTIGTPNPAGGNQIFHIYTAGANFQINLTSDTATNLAAAISSDTTTGILAQTITTSSNVITATAPFTDNGSIGNTYTCLSSSPTVLSCTGAKFTNGKDNNLLNASLTFFVQGTSVVVSNPANWPLTQQSSNTATNIQAAIAAAIPSNVFLSTVNLNGTTILSTAAVLGAGPNSWAITSSTPGALTTSSNVFTGGQNAGIVTVGGYQFIANTSYQTGATGTTAATNLAAAISTWPTAGILNCQSVATVVTCTSTLVGAWTNFPLKTNTTGFTLSNGGMTGGTDSDINYNYLPNQYIGDFINILYPNGGVPYYTSLQPSFNNIHKTSGFSAGMAVLFTTSTAGSVAPKPLVNGTTYFVSNIVLPTFNSTGTFQLIDTATGAAAGLFFTLSTNTLVGGDSFSLTPLGLTGTPSFNLQQSNDGVNFTQISVSTGVHQNETGATQSFASPYTTTSVWWNLSPQGSQWIWRYLRFVYNAGTQGATNISYIINAKKNTNP